MKTLFIEPGFPSENGWRRFAEWTTDGTLEKAHCRLLQKLGVAGKLNLGATNRPA